MLPWTKIRSQLARAIRDGAPEETVVRLRGELRTARAAVYLREVLAADPPLTHEQRGELADILRPAA